MGDIYSMICEGSGPKLVCCHDLFFQAPSDFVATKRMVDMIIIKSVHYYFFILVDNIYLATNGLIGVVLYCSSLRINLQQHRNRAWVVGSSNQEFPTERNFVNTSKLGPN